MKIELVNPNFQEDYVNNLLRARGVKNPEDYWCPTSKYLEPANNLDNIDAAANLYLGIVRKDGAKVLIVVDDDDDGNCSSAIIYQYTKRLAPAIHLDFMCHERKAHGLEDLIDEIINGKTHYDLIILPDSSSNDFEYHEKLAEIGTRCLVMDHHSAIPPFSPNAIIVNNQLSPRYTNKALSGAGVTWQFCRYLDGLLGVDWAWDYIDIAATGNIGDMCSMLTMENRYLNYVALNKEHLKNPFLRALLEKQAYSITGQKDADWDTICGSVDAINIAFYIVPLVNALIRIGTLEEKEQLFRAFIEGNTLVPSTKRGAKGETERLAVEMARICGNARDHQNKQKEDALFNIEVKIANYDLLSNKILFIRLDEDDVFPASLNGLIANYLAQKYKRPTIVARKGQDGFDKGSGRGLNQSDLTDFRQFLLDSGYVDFAEGHPQSFGLAISDSKLSAFHEYANQALAAIDFGESTYKVNFVRSAFSSDLYELIISLCEASRLWGQDNPAPLLHITHLKVNPSLIRVLGPKKDTLKIETSTGVAFMKFKAEDMIAEIQSRTEPFEIEVVGRPNLNTWNGMITPQIFIDDYDIYQESSSITAF